MHKTPFVESKCIWMFNAFAKVRNCTTAVHRLCIAGALLLLFLLLRVFVFCCCFALSLSFSFVVVSPVQRMCNMQCKTIRCKLDSRTVPVIGRQLCVITFDTLSSACVGGEVISVVYRLRFTAFLNTHTHSSNVNTREQKETCTVYKQPVEQHSTQCIF